MVVIESNSRATGVVVEYQEFGKQHQAFVCGTSGKVFGSQQLVFPSPWYAAAVKAINSLSWQAAKTHAQSSVRLVRLLKRYARYLILPPVLLSSVVGLAISPLLHVYGLWNVRRAIEASWQAQVKAELAAQSAGADTWAFRFGGGFDQASALPVTEKDLQRNAAVALQAFQSAGCSIDELVAKALRETDASSALQVAGTLALAYDAIGFSGVGPRADMQSIRRCFRREMARASAEARSADISTLRSVYGGLCNPNSRQVIDELWWAKRL